MKETVLDVLIYLFDNVFDADMETDQAVLTDELEAAGFEKMEIDKAFDWLEELHSAQALTEGVKAQTLTSTRLLTEAEMDRLSVECQGFLMAMEQCGILDAQLREMVIDRVLALETAEIDVKQLKWIILMIICNTDRETGPPVEWVEEIMLGDFAETMH